MTVCCISSYHRTVLETGRRGRPNPSTRNRSRRSRQGVVPFALFGFGNNEEKKEREREKEAQFKAQQEILARRKNNSWQQDVKERRAKASRYMQDPEFKKQCDEENRKKFLAKKEAEGPEPTGFAFIVPIAPFGMPEYDGGERFDLRLPYVDQGWVDEDADVAGKVAKQFKRFIGLDKKEKRDKNDTNRKKK